MTQTSVDPITTDTITNALKHWVENKISIPPSSWLDACAKLIILLEDEHIKLFDLQQQVARQRIELLENGMNATQTKMRVEGGDEYRLMSLQRAKIARIEELSRISKKMASLKDNEYRMQ